jgi:hypothetical protein
MMSSAPISGRRADIMASTGSPAGTSSRTALGGLSAATRTLSVLHGKIRGAKSPASAANRWVTLSVRL